MQHKKKNQYQVSVIIIIKPEKSERKKKMIINWKYMLVSQETQRFQKKTTALENNKVSSYNHYQSNF